MSAALAHRGRDGSGIWSGASVAFGHRLLHTTPESVRETQPLTSSHSSSTIVADARLDNRDELIAALGLAPAPSLSDAKIVLAAYERWGRNFANRLIGDFAIAIWDERTRTLLCARDPLGVKPFYYFLDDRQFAFASEIKALHAAPGVDASVDPEQVALFVGWFHEDRSRTIFRRTLRLPAAHTMAVAPGRFSLERYWSPGSAPDVRFGSDTDYIEGFREIFTLAVSARMRCAGQLGATLSGGLDSSSIVCVSRHLRRQVGAPLHTFSLVFPDLPEPELRLIDERRYVDSVIALGGIQPHFVHGDRLSPMRDARRILWHLDEPYSAPNLYLHWGMFEAASETGVRVLLDGFDGDTAVSHGFGRLTSLARAGAWDTLESEVTEFSAHHRKPAVLAIRQFVAPYLTELARATRFGGWWRASNEITRRFGLSRRELAADYGLRALVPDSLRQFSRAPRGPGAPENAVLRPTLARALREHRRLVEREQSRRPAFTERDTHIDGLSRPLYQLTLETADKAAAAFGIEPRYPFFDRRLIEFCVGLPEEQKFANGWPRAHLRRAMEGILPPEVQWRSTKSNLGPNFYRRLRAVDLVPDRGAPTKALSPYLRLDRLLAAQRRDQDLPNGAQADGSALLLFRIAILEMWLNGRAEDRHQAQPTVDALSPTAA